MADQIALLCTLYPSSNENKERLIELLRGAARAYYSKPASKCTTWSYMTPALARGASSTAKLVLCGLEMYTSKEALSTQQADSDSFQTYHDTVKQENLYAAPEKLVAWYQSGGFVSRSEHAKPFGGRVLVTVSHLVCTDAQPVISRMRSFSDWVRASEPDVLTYIIFTRPKAPNEVLIIVRYRDSKALKGHDEAPEHQNIMTVVKAYFDTEKTTTTVWREMDGSFVSTTEGGPQEDKPSAKI